MNPLTRKQQYFRYVPRIDKGRELLTGDLKTAIEKKDWKAVNALFADENLAPNSLRVSGTHPLSCFDAGFLAGLS